MGIIRSLAKTNQLFRNCTFWSYEKLDPTVKISVTVNAASKETCGQSNNVYDSGRPEIERTLWRGAERHGNWLTPVSVDRHFVRATDLPLAAVDAPVPSLTAAAPGPRDRDGKPACRHGRLLNSAGRPSRPVGVVYTCRSLRRSRAGNIVN